jgi:hypothetical protein
MERQPIGRPIINKMTILPKVNSGFNIIPMKIPAVFFFFPEMEMLILKLQRILNIKTILKTRMKLEYLYFPNFKTYGAGIRTDICTSGTEVRVQK